MSDIVSQAVSELNDKVQSAGFDGTAKFQIEGEGAVMISSAGAEAVAEDAAADVTLVADADTFKGILDGSENPTTAFMTGKLKVEGDMGMAMKLASVLG